MDLWSAHIQPVVTQVLFCKSALWTVTPACIAARDYSILHVGLPTSLCWTAWDSWQLISPARKSPSDKQLCPPAHQPLPSPSLVTATSLLMVHSIRALHPCTPSVHSISSSKSLDSIGLSTGGWHLQPAVIWTLHYFLSQPFEPHDTANFTSTLKPNYPSHIPPVWLQAHSGRPCQAPYKSQSQWHPHFSPCAQSQSSPQRIFSGWSAMICPW